MEYIVTDMYTVFMMTKNVMSMMLMFVPLAIQIYELGQRPHHPYEPHNPYHLNHPHQSHHSY